MNKGEYSLATEPFDFEDGQREAFDRSNELERFTIEGFQRQLGLECTKQSQPQNEDPEHENCGVDVFMLCYLRCAVILDFAAREQIVLRTCSKC